MNATTPAPILERIVTDEDHHISVIHDERDGFTVANIALNDIPDNGTDFTLPELLALIDQLSEAADLLAEHAPVPYTVAV